LPRDGAAVTGLPLPAAAAAIDLAVAIDRSAVSFADQSSGRPSYGIGHCMHHCL
jgi:hypothetical protein